ncbi:MAG: TonB-dependent receptor [Bacteroidota bacterium]
MPKIVLPLFCWLLLASTALAQPGSPPARVSLNSTSLTLDQVLQQLSAQSGVKFSYNPEAIAADQTVVFQCQDVDLDRALQQLAEKVPIEYLRVEAQIVILPRSEVPAAPSYYTISGFLTDASTGESLIGASVFVGGSQRGTFTNEFGFYSLRLVEGAARITYSYVGYEARRLELTLTADRKQSLRLQARLEELPDVIVERPLREVLREKQMGELTLRPEDLENMPEFGGESGTIKGLQTLPGIKSHSDGSAFFFTRGGEKDQNLIIIDDAPIYNPAHLFGFYSMVIPDFAKSIKVYKSDIPTSLGDRLSSVIDIRTVDGNSQRWSFRGSLNPLLNRFALEGPLVKGRSSIFASVRRSNFDWLYRNAAPNSDLGFSDFSFKWNYRLNDKNRLFFTVINGRDDLIARGDSLGSVGGGIAWGNFTSTLRWNHLFNAKLFSNTVLYVGVYNYRLSFENNDWQSGIGQLSLKSDFTYYVRPRLSVKFGVEFSGYSFNPGALSTGALLEFFPPLQTNSSRQQVLYGSLDLRPTERWRLRAGLRYTSWDNWGPAEYFLFNDDFVVSDSVQVGAESYQSYHNLGPRLSAEYQLDSTSTLKASYGLYYQYLQLISNSASPFTSLEVWLPSSPNIRPQSMQQFALGYQKYFPRRQIEWSAEAYYKRWNNQIDYRPHANVLLNPLIEGELRFGTMYGYGIELMLQKKLGRWSGWLSYTYSRVLRRTPGINGGREYPAFQDRPHDFTLLVNCQVTRRFRWSTYWTAYTGSAFSSPTGFYQFQDYRVPIYDEKNNDRLPTYQRLDLALGFTLNKKPDAKYQHHLIFSVYNVLGHKNVVSVNFNKVILKEGEPLVQANYANERELRSTQTDLIRFFPSLSYKFKL